MTKTDEELEAILAGCEGVTPGPWAVGGGWTDSGSQWIGIRTWSYNDVIGEYGAISSVDLNYIARLDPDTVASIIRELLAEPIPKPWEWRPSRARAALSATEAK